MQNTSFDFPILDNSAPSVLAPSLPDDFPFHSQEQLPPSPHQYNLHSITSYGFPDSAFELTAPLNFSTPQLGYPLATAPASFPDSLTISEPLGVNPQAFITGFDVTPPPNLSFGSVDSSSSFDGSFGIPVQSPAPNTSGWQHSATTVHLPIPGPPYPNDARIQPSLAMSMPPGQFAFFENLGFGNIGQTHQLGSQFHLVVDWIPFNHVYQVPDFGPINPEPFGFESTKLEPHNLQPHNFQLTNFEPSTTGTSQQFSQQVPTLSPASTYTNHLSNSNSPPHSTNSTSTSPMPLQQLQLDTKEYHRAAMKAQQNNKIGKVNVYAAQPTKKTRKEMETVFRVVEKGNESKKGNGKSGGQKGC